MRLGRYGVFAAALLVLAGCGDGASDVATSGDGLEATGEVLEPTVSDAMIATDQLRSSPPLLRAQPSAPTSDDEESAGDDTEAAPEDDFDAAFAGDPEPEAEESAPTQ